MVDVMAENPKKAIELFEKVVEMESALGDTVKWRFLALQHLVTLNFTLGSYEDMLKRYRAMLTHMASVTRNECTDAINAILDVISPTNAAAGTSSSGKAANADSQNSSSNSSKIAKPKIDSEVLSEVYKITLLALKNSNNERLWFITNQKLAKLYLDSSKFQEVEELLVLLKKSCRTSDGLGDDPSKGTYLLEIYSLEIQLCVLTSNSMRMRHVYPKTVNLNAAVVDPRVMGVIREEGGKMYMAEGQWDEAYNELYEAFRNYQEAGNSRARDCLKYVVLASMLALSNINPFVAREAKVYQDDKEIIAMSDLRQSLESNDLRRFERILHDKKNRIEEEPLLMKYIQPLRRRMHEQVVINLVRPYERVSLDFIAQELLLSVDDIEKLVVDMIVNDKLKGSIDQLRGYIVLANKNNSNAASNAKLESLARWATALEKIDLEQKAT